MTENAVTTSRHGGDASHWYSPTLWYGMTMRAWFRMLRAHGFRISPARLPMAFLSTLWSVNNSALGLAQAAIHGRRVKRTRINQRPVFLIGHWRSGTTHLHELLALDERFAFPTTFECAAPNHCLLTASVYPKLFSWCLPDKRVMDDMQLGFDRPQEDELALVATGVPSPYWSWAYPGERKGQDFLTLRDVPRPEREAWMQALLHFLRLVAYRNGDKPLLLKSPPHTGRLALLAQQFPQARFLHIVREPCAVFASTMHLWKTNQALNRLVRTEDQNLEGDVLRSLQHMYSGFDAAKASLPAGQFHQIRYEDLIRDPLTVLDESYRALALGDFAVVKPRIEAYLSSVRDYQANRFTLSPAAKAAVAEAWGPIFRPWGYSV